MLSVPRSALVIASALLVGSVSCRAILGIDPRPVEESDASTIDGASDSNVDGSRRGECALRDYASADFCDDFEDETASRARWPEARIYDSNASLRFEAGSVVMTANAADALLKATAATMSLAFPTVATTFDGGPAPPAIQMDMELSIESMELPPGSTLEPTLYGRTGTTLPESYFAIGALGRAPQATELLAPGAVLGLTSDALSFGAAENLFIGRTPPVQKVVQFDASMIGKRVPLRVVTGPRWVLSRFPNTCETHSLICRDCAHGGCPVEEDNCKDECTAILRCVSAPGCDAACQAACVDANDAGAAQYAAYSTCINQRGCSCRGYCPLECPDAGPADPTFLDEKTFVMAGLPNSKLDCVYSPAPLVATGQSYAAFVGLAARGNAKITSRVHVIAVRQLKP